MRQKIESLPTSMVLLVIAVFCSVAMIVVGILIHFNPTTPEPVAEEELICYEPYGSNVEPQFLADYVFVKVHYLTQPLPDGSDGAAMFAFDPVTGLSACEVWIPMPMQVLGDPAMDTIGHEFLHCLSGHFHE